MLYIFHGEDEVASRNHIHDLKKKHNYTLIEYKSSDTTVNQILSHYSSNALFDDKFLIVLDGTKDRFFKFEELFASFPALSETHALVLWFGQELTKTHPAIKSSADKHPQIREFKKQVKSTVFNFLDVLFEKKRKEAYAQLDYLLTSGENEFEIITMILFNLRNISFAAFDTKALNKLHPFVKEKSLKLAKTYNQETLQELYEFMYYLDIQLKTGKVLPDVAIILVVEKILNL